MINYEYMSKFWDDSVPKDYLIETNNHSIQITNENLHSQTITINESLTSSDGSISFGDCEASSIRFKVSGHTTPLTGKWLYVYVTMPGTTQFRFGRYKVVSDTPVDGNRYREVVAYDRIYFVLNKDYKRWYNKLFKTNPQMTIKQFRDAFFTRLNITQNTITLINDDITIKKAKVSKLSGRDILKAIGEVNGVFGHLDRDGSFSWKKLYDSTPIVISRSYVTDIEYEDYNFASLDRLEILNSDGTLGAEVGDEEDDDINTYTVESNFILATLDDNYLQHVADTLYEICDASSAFRPVKNLELKGNPCLEVGDRISINTNQGEIITFILQRTIKGGQSLRDTVTSDSQEFYTQDANTTTSKIQSTQYDATQSYVQPDTPAGGKDGDLYFKNNTNSYVSPLHPIAFDDYVTEDSAVTHNPPYHFVRPTDMAKVPQNGFNWDIHNGYYTMSVKGMVYKSIGTVEPDTHFIANGGFGSPALKIDVPLERAWYKISCDAKWECSDDAGGYIVGLSNWISHKDAWIGTPANGMPFTVKNEWQHYERVYEFFPDSSWVSSGDPVYMWLYMYFPFQATIPGKAHFECEIKNLLIEKITDTQTGTTDTGMSPWSETYVDGFYTKLPKTEDGTAGGDWQEIEMVQKVDQSENSGLSYTRPTAESQRTLSLTPEVMRAWVKPDPPQIKRKFNQYCVRYTGKPDGALNITLQSNTGWLNKSIKKDSEGVYTIKSGGAVSSSNIEYCVYKITGFVSGQRYYFNLKCNFMDGTTFGNDYTKGLGLVFNTTGTISTDNWTGDPGTFDSENLYYSMPRKTSAFFANFDFVATATTMYMCVVVADIESGEVSSLTLSRFVISKTEKAYIRNFYLFDLEQNDWLQYKPWGSGDESGEGGASSLSDLDDVNLDNIQNGQSLYYDSATGEWKNGDAPTSIEEMTQSVYNTLSPAQKTDGTVRFVYDPPTTQFSKTVLGTTYGYADLSSVNVASLMVLVSNGNVAFAGFKFDTQTRVSSALTGLELSTLADSIGMQSSVNFTCTITQDDDTPSCVWVNNDWYNTSTMYLDATDMSNVGIKNSYYEYSTSLFYKTAGGDNAIYLNDRDYSGSGGGGGGSTVIANPTGTPTDQLDTVQIGDTIYEIACGGSGSGGSAKKTEIVEQKNVAIADGTAITLNLTKKYSNPYVFATNTLPKTGWGGLVTVNEDYGVTYDSSNDTLSFKVYTNYAQNYDIYWMIIELDDAGGGGSGYARTSLWSGTQSTAGQITLDDDINNYDALEFVTKLNNGAHNTVVVDAKSFSTDYPYTSSVSANIPHYCLLGYDNCFARVITGSTTSSLYAWDFTSLYLAEVNGIKYGGGSSSSQETYSTTEQVVGTWIDEKPVYQKTFQTNFSANATDWINTGVTIADLETIVDLKISGTDSYTGTTVPAYLNAPYNRYYNNNIQIYLFYVAWAGATMTSVTVRYTKTTD